MFNILISLLVSLCSLYTLTKGTFMEGNHIDKIDVKRDHKELIALYYKMELKAFIQCLLYEHQTSKGLVLTGENRDQSQE
jgi:hypothetical protein